MHVDVNGTRLWFDVDGPVLVPDGARMRRRPTVIVVHGGPGGYDHSYFKPHFGPLVGVAQVIYVDLRDHGRSARHDPADWSLVVPPPTPVLGELPRPRVAPLLVV